MTDHIYTQCQRLPLPDQRVPEVPQLGHCLEAASPHEVEVLCVAVCGLGAQLAEELLMVTLVTHDTCNIATTHLGYPEDELPHVPLLVLLPLPGQLQAGGRGRQ